VHYLDHLQHRFAHHPPRDQEVILAHAETRNRFAALADWVAQLPPCPERDRAIDALDTACMLSNAAIARTQLRTDYYPDGTGSSPASPG